MDDLRRGLAEDVDVIVANLLADFHVGTVHGAQGQGAVEHELHVAGAGGFLGGKADLLRQVTGGDHLLCGGDVVVLHKHDLQPLGHFGIGGNDLGQGQQSVDDVLGDDVSRGGLGAEDGHQGNRGQVTGLDLKILVDQVQQVQLLPLVLMQPLGLNVEHGVGVHSDALLLLKPAAQLPLVFLLDFRQPLQYGGVVGEGQQLFQLGCILVEALADEVLDLAGQQGIALGEPAAEGDAVGLVVELFGVQLVEAVQFGILQNLGVQRGHAIGGVGEVDIHVGHVHLVIPVDDGKAFVLGALFHQRVQLLDNGHQLGHHGIQIGTGPLFQSFCQNGVVGVGAGFGDDLHSLTEFDALFAQQTDQLGNHHAGVGVVDLNGGVVGKVIVIAAPGGTLVQNQLGTCGNHQILLVDPQLAAGLVGIVGVQEQSQVLVNGGLVKVDAVVDDAFVYGVDVKQVQGVGAALVAGDCQLIKPCGVVFAAQGDGVGDIRLFRPAVGAEPGIGQLLLHTVRKRLVEQAKVVAQAHAVAGQVQRGEGIQEAGCQTAQAAVAQRRLRLHFLNVRQVLARGGQSGAYLVIQPQVDQVVGQQLSNQELRADIVQLPALHGTDLLGTFLINQLQKREIQLLVGALFQLLPGQSGEGFGHSHKGIPPFLVSVTTLYHEKFVISCTERSNYDTILSQEAVLWQIQRRFRKISATEKSGFPLIFTPAPSPKTSPRWLCTGRAAWSWSLSRRAEVWSRWGWSR